MLMMVPGLKAWEENYRRRGMLWGGVTHELPELAPGSRVLELGCGSGKTLRAMGQRGWNVTGIDFSSTAVLLSRQVYSDPSQGQVMVADVRKSPFKNATFDAVFAIHVIGHMPEYDRREITHEVNRILKPGGFLFFRDFSTEDFRFGKGSRTEATTFERDNHIITHYFTSQEVVDLFSGLNQVSVNMHQWQMRVRGKNLLRSEITGVFTHGDIASYSAADFIRSA
jgi:ubiquinone/menaquinone biosynthesis C-methylase UbiE